MEYIWSLEFLMEKCDRRGEWAEDYPDKSDAVLYTDDWFMALVARRATFLWQGEQVDGSAFVWGSEADYLPTYAVLALPTAVMAGYRYLTSLKSSPRFMRAPMHWSLFNKGLHM